MAEEKKLELGETFIGTIAAIQQSISSDFIKEKWNDLLQERLLFFF